MRLIAKKPCSYGGQQFFIGDEIPGNLVADAKREEQLGVISIVNADAGVSGEAGTLFTQEQVDGMIADAVAKAREELKQEQTDGDGVLVVTLGGEGAEKIAVPCTGEDIQTFIDILEKSADDAAKAIADVKSDSVLILLHDLDTRSTVKKAAQKQHDTLSSADGITNEASSGNATTDTSSEGADT